MDDNSAKQYLEIMDEEKTKKIYSKEKFWRKLAGHAKKAGLNVVYFALVLFFMTKSPNVPTKDKAMIIAGLAYLITPIDVVPDFIPVAGYSDDLAVLIFIIGKVAYLIDDDSKNKAKEALKKWFGEDVDVSKLDVIL
ncbi:DUF1232 domain-containing protein [Sporolactobacillus sp. STSJ-5]|uniref:YkvA family protein n=1 Tax=Sporolactobacillus sp. STSJ-5 TaxID=2965076 RepID=UPI002104BECD|nr:DUF1232 domain-containing protein [Sporolactobacillus sp. STSJ-5]MCQ2011168.1 DUF1232 domain-containing protein [Sporolactobacillus sp. STSJ-5]